MAHFARVDEDGIVREVLVVPNSQQHRGSDFLSDDLGLGGLWIKTSYNTRGGVHYDPETGLPSEDQSQALRYNFAGTGMQFDPDFGNDGAFYAPQPFPSWSLNPATARWEPPTPRPESGGAWEWDEATESWVEVVGGT